MQKKFRRKLKPAVTAVVCAAVVLIIGLTVWLLSRGNKEDNQEYGSVGIDIIGTKDSRTTESTEGMRASVKIDLPSCTIPVGTILQVTATVTSESDTALHWTSSDAGVLTVDETGMITVAGKGMAALTATLGNVSDAIIIEGVFNTDEPKAGNLPIYDVATGTIIDKPGDPDNIPTLPGKQDPTQSAGDPGRPEETTASGGNKGDPISDPTNPPPPEDPTQGGTPPGGIGLKSTELYDKLEQIGYKRHIASNVFIYEENNEYLGQIVIQPGLTILFIKNRSEAFDEKISLVLSKLLPHEFQNVWRNYLAASSVRTFVTEKRTVRIEPALKGGHSQIVIYN